VWVFTRYLPYLRDSESLNLGESVGQVRLLVPKPLPASVLELMPKVPPLSPNTGSQVGKLLRLDWSRWQYNVMEMHSRLLLKIGASACMYVQPHSQTEQAY
jgi:hypothetical protein